MKLDSNTKSESSKFKSNESFWFAIKRQPFQSKHTHTHREGKKRMICNYKSVCQTNTDVGK